ncbi:GGDEF domain-containing protein [Granulicella arctica]|uniref:diguanylate cyclase n=1 Tax=Granulicella arctica TaxID=940613 RepID=A0A7Y9PDZ4_9BACT|nr:GGDEF domain-containing protein [Granulicella arctica]NYF78172.1 diguanylate cyclase (GGDEF)-like protein [Granulicella arctica]
MLSRPLTLRLLLAAAAAYVLLHGLSMAVCSAHAAAISYCFVIVATLLAVTGCIRRAQAGPADMRLPWTMVGVGILLWCCGAALEGWQELVQHVSSANASSSDFIIFIFGVPILLAISTPTRQDRRLFFVWLDSIQAVMTAYLIYLAFFTVSPFTHKPIEPISASTLILIYTVENLVLAGSASLRLFAHQRKGDSHYFYWALTCFLWIYTICIAISNYVYLTNHGNTGFYDLLSDLPFLFLAAASVLLVRGRTEDSPVFDRGKLMLFIDNLSPTFFTAALFLLSFAVMRQHFYAGIVSALLALSIYSIRTTMLQSLSVRAEQRLREAHDRLEAISLTDSLTGVANRRHFDRTLEMEWNRTVRTRHPLALLIIDIDYFKKLNDRYGHPHGDRCLIRIAQAMRDGLPRSGDLLARYGGEEFLLLLPTTDQAGAELVAARMQKAVASLDISYEPEHRTTISIGLAVSEHPHSGTTAELIDAADDALYRAKKNGRDRVEIGVFGVRHLKVE